MRSSCCGVAAVLALLGAPAAVNAQTVITREITTEPVETIVEQGPSGTVITRRPLDTSAPAVAPPPAPVVGERVETVTRATTGLSTTYEAPPVPVASRRVAVSPPRTASAGKQIRTGKPQTVRAAFDRRTVETARRPRSSSVAVARAAAGPVPALTANQRGLIYRTVVRDRVVPRTVVTEDPVLPAEETLVTAPVREEVVTERVIAPPFQPPIRERIVTAPLATETVGAAPVVDVPVVSRRVVTTPAASALVVGSRLPATVPIYALPPTLVRQVPAVQPYGYAVVDDRVLLIDPATNLVVDELM